MGSRRMCESAELTFAILVLLAPSVILKDKSKDSLPGVIKSQVTNMNWTLVREKNHIEQTEQRKKISLGWGPGGGADE